MSLPPLAQDEQTLRLLRDTATAERRNRPRWMISLGLAVLAGGLIFAGVSWTAHTAATRQLASERADDRDLTNMLLEIQRLSEPPEQGDLQVYDPLEGPVTMLEDAADRVGLDRPAPPRLDRDEQVTPTISRKLFRYTNVTHGSADALLQWLTEVEQTVEGMQVHSLELIAGDSTWRMSVTFSRLETSS